ncbi:hypothetical protein TanjilG_11218 [Lupinus angustifolius]|uniref:GH3 family protein n=1 Tax=Lupinus angustifolius TaxID=3871 RepID=A0A1J7GPH6_LUPAN|nr:PREDICTED: jasmonic acid-amido synthetase JAR1-like [Lupinus angustifolius]OIW02324.1 hypothetical protein TanjilG_11218 [Lupinus angustifolius]
MLENLEEYTEKLIEEFEAISKDAERVQKETLRSILEENASAEYLQSLGLNGKTDPESFKAIIPLVTHDDLEPYIKRIFDGDNSPILTGKPIPAITLSSGTTKGKSKYVPWNETFLDSGVQILHTAFAIRDRELPIKNGKCLSIVYLSAQSQTKGGLKLGTIASHVIGNKRYTEAMAAIKSEMCSPQEVISAPDFQQAMYCHLLCGLIFRDQIQLLEALFIHSIVQAFRTFEQVWEELCNDIREGVLNSRITIPSVRAAMSKILKPDPEKANLIHKICTGLNNWYGVIQELFPNAKYLLAIATGSMEAYLPSVRHYAGELPVVTNDYGASEGWVGTNLHPTVPAEFASYTVFPNCGYYEFIPLSEDAIACVDPKPVGLTEVKVGEEYEIVMTTRTGLYRYKLGDVVKVTGFYNSTPELKFIRRSGTLLSINIDKNTENDLRLAVVAASKVLAEEKLEVVDYTSHVDSSQGLGHYVILFEISGEASEEVLGECCNSLEKSFVDAGYTSSRKVNNIGPLELRVVRPGTFQKIFDHFIGMGASPTQLKTPRCVPPTSTKVMQILNDNVLNKYISTVFN